MKLKLRHIAATAVVSAAIAITPVCVEFAYLIRGGRALGGEVLIIPLGLLIAWVILEAANELDEYILRKQRQEMRRRRTEIDIIVITRRGDKKWRNGKRAGNLRHLAGR